MAKVHCSSKLPICVFLFIVEYVAAAAPLLGGKKLIIGIPKDVGIQEFVNVELNATTNQVVDVNGFSIEVFNATVAHLLHSGINVSFEYQAFVDKSGKRAGSYDQLLQQIPAKKYDAVAGDISIVANRSNYVDFTLPYAESGVMMLVRVGHDPHLNMWVFLRPFSWDLWLTIILSCVFIGATIRFMERNINRDATFEGSPMSMFWLPLVQMVLPQRESVAKNCSKFVLMVWLILAFILMQSYTASLSSMLTLDQLQPNYPSVNDLQRNGDYIGYPTASFVLDLLVKDLKFDKSKLKEFKGIEDYREALDKGTRNGGVAAVFEETPYLKIFLKKFGSKYYRMIGPRYRTGGFGFAFPKDSNLTSYFSRAILNVTQQVDAMDQIERKYYGSNSDDDDFRDQFNVSADNPSLKSHSFAGLFMITGSFTLLGLLISESRIWKKPVRLAKTYSQKYLIFSLHFKKINQSAADTSTSEGNVGSTSEPNDINPERPKSPCNLAIETLPL